MIQALIPHRLFAHVPVCVRLWLRRRIRPARPFASCDVPAGDLDYVHRPFDLDAVLGAFAAGLILRTLTPPAALHMMTHRLEVVGFTFMIPLFFVVSADGY